MIAELISVGTELLLGNIVNTNAAYLAKACAGLGLSMYYQSVVGDNKERLQGAVKTALKRSDVVIFTGGLGPTQDDLTKDVVAAVMGKKLVEDEKAKKMIEKYMEGFLKNHPGRQVTENNWCQAMVPEDAIVLYNDNGTAPGLIIEDGNKIAILLPGPPNEMKPMFEQSVYPYLKKRQPEVIYSQMIKICGIGESQVETDILDLIDKQTNPTIATYAKVGEVDLRITAKAKDEKEAKKLVKPLVRELKVRFGRNIFATDEKKSLEEAVVDLLKDQNLTLTLAESCTGGALAARLVNVPGASEVFYGSFVTYSNKAKRKNLLVKKMTLKTEGAVSAKTAKEMAKGGCGATGCNVCVSVTGIAGPEGGSKEKPVGTVFMGCCLNGQVTVREYHFSGNRSKIREQSVTAALVLLRDCILESHGKN